MCPFVVRESFSSGRPLNKIVTGIRPPEPDELNSDDHFKNKLNFFLPAFSSFSGFLPPLFFFLPPTFRNLLFSEYYHRKGSAFFFFFPPRFLSPRKNIETENSYSEINLMPCGPSCRNYWMA